MRYFGSGALCIGGGTFFRIVSSSSFMTSAVSLGFTVSAPRLSWSWAMDVAPMMAVETFGLTIVHASASCGIVQPSLAAKGRRSSAIAARCFSRSTADGSELAAARPSSYRSSR